MNHLTTRFCISLVWATCAGVHAQSAPTTAPTPGVSLGADSRADPNTRPLSYGASLSLQKDNNYNRASAGLERSESIFDARANLGYKNQVSRQGFALDANLGKQFYSSNSGLNTLVYGVSGLWNWEYGPLWFGTANLGLNRRVASASEQLTGTQNIVKGWSFGVTPGYRLDTRWSVVSGLDYGVSDNSSVVLRSADSRNLGYEIGVRYQPGTTLDGALVLRHVEGKYASVQLFNAFGAPLGTPINNDYAEDRLLLRGNWRVSEASALNGNVGLTRRSYDSALGRNFSGLTWGLGYAFNPGTSWTANLGFSRDIGNESYVFSSHVDSRVLSAALTWQATGKISVSPSFSLNQRSYSGDASGSGVNQGRSNVSRFSVVANYDFAPGLLLNASLGQERRGAGASLSGYNATQMSLGAQFRF
jgi:hypothetical protein